MRTQAARTATTRQRSQQTARRRPAPPAVAPLTMPDAGAALARLGMLPPGQPHHKRPMVTLPIPLPVKLPPHPSKDPRAGNNLKLTNAIAEKVLAAKRGGASDLAAAAWAGVADVSISRWRHHPGEPYETFRVLLAEAETYPKMFLLDAIMANAYSDPKIALELLARLEPETYGKIVVIEDRTNPLGNLIPPLNGVAGVFSADLGGMLERILARRLAQEQDATPVETQGGGPGAPRMAASPVLGAALPARPRDPRPPKALPQAGQTGGKR